MAAAHSIVKNGTSEDKIIIIERNSSVGGQARSVTKKDGNHSEYCWHAIGKGYAHFINLLSEIPIKKGLSVLNNLKPIEIYMYGRKNGHCYTEVVNSFVTSTSLIDFCSGVKRCGGKLTWKDIYILSKTWIYANIISKKTLDLTDTIRWVDMMEGLSHEARIWLVDSTSIFLGMDYSNLSSQTMLSLFRHTVQTEHITSPNNFYSFNGPMHTAFLEPWKKYLEKKGVVFKMETDITEIITEYENISSIKIKNKFGNSEILKADQFINGLPIEVFSELLPDYNLQTVVQKTSQIQTQVLYKFDKKLPINKPAILMFPDSPWFLMARHEGILWDLNGKDYLSVGIGIWDRKGIIFGKTASECTREELADECWSQMLATGSGLMEKLNINFINTPDWDIWESFKHNGTKLTTYEPKFSNSVGIYTKRPKICDDLLDNLSHATAYAKTDTNIFCMESAVEAGSRAGKNSIGLSYKNEYERSKPRGCLTRFFRNIL